ncbi:MAG: hypothetical protein EU535_08875, partial [Promethearchaeota archaeon]
MVKTKYPETELLILEEHDPTMFLDDVELPEEVEKAIQNADLLISYIRHPDVVFEICDRQKPTILAINFGQGFLNQVKSSNPKVVQPISMCNSTPDTGIEEIDEYFRKFGSPVYKVELDYLKDHIPIVREISLIVESPCGASNASLDLIKGKEVTLENLNAFALNVRQECRE